MPLTFTVMEAAYGAGQFIGNVDGFAIGGKDQMAGTGTRREGELLGTRQSYPVGGAVVYPNFVSAEVADKKLFGDRIETDKVRVRRFLSPGNAVTGVRQMARRRNRITVLKFELADVTVGIIGSIEVSAVRGTHTVARRLPFS